MKTLTVTLVFFSLVAVAFAGEPQIIETDNGYVVEYSGTPESVGADGFTDSQRYRLKQEAEEAEALKAKKEANIAATEAARAERNLRNIIVDNLGVSVISNLYGLVKFSVKVDVVNPRDSIGYHIQVTATDKDGFQLDSIILSGWAPTDKRVTFTGTCLLDDVIARRIHKWDVAKAVTAK